MRPHEAFHVFELIRSNSLSPLRRKGVVLSVDDSQTVYDVYQQWLMLLLDLGYLHPETLLRDGRRLWLDITKEDVLDLNNAFAECLQLIRLQTNKGFKALCSRISSHLYHLVKGDMELILAGDVIAAKRLIQLFSYTSRLSLNDIDLTQQLLEDYLANEELIPLDYPSDLLTALNKVLRRWLGPYVPQEIIPKHGPGGIAERGRCSLQEKYSLLRTDRRLSYAFGDTSCYTQFASENSPLDRCSKTIFVPKSYKTFRTISMEPATLQFFQQGIWKAIENQVKGSSYRGLRGEFYHRRRLISRYVNAHIGFRDQARNRLLAQEGSLNRNYATIDLSAASDSVGYNLVKRVFRGTWLLRYLVATRSTETLLPDGQRIKLNKFAPMGSALCFPIETLVFAAVCEIVTQEYHVTGDYSVFGDDIILPTQCVDRCIEVLGILGFKTNLSKSYTSSECWFRESCGGEYCDGFDVTPMRVSRKYASKEDNIRLAKLISLANTAYSKGYKHLRYFFLKKLRDEGITPLFAPTSLHSENYTNFHTAKRWNPYLQRLEVKVHDCISTIDRRGKKDHEEMRYFHWLLNTVDRKYSELAFEANVRKTLVRFKSVWREKPVDEFDQLVIQNSCKSDKFLSV